MAGRTAAAGRGGRDQRDRRGPGAGSGPPPPAGRGARLFRAPRLPEGRGRRRLPLLLALGPALLIGGLALWLLYGSAWLRVERVTVDGERVLTERRILEVAGIPLGEPLVSVDPGEVERRLLEALPRIDSVEAARSWPHGMELTVTERKAVVVMVQDARNGEGGGDQDGTRGRRYAEVDDEGVLFGTLAERPAGVPLLTLDLAGSADGRRFGPERMRQEAVGVAAALPERVRRDIRTIRVRSYDSITLEMSGGRTVVWGSGEDSDAKARSLTLLMKTADAARRFDVSVPGAPAVSGS
ncbi:FtsQ-type POTRA domain-containing protein [Streptomyces sp. CNQ085]|uniref:cell division protein FtsQ/DivIB n=1 Tax=Streptomyces sp. CNQ085 TaxID=2886944 RepID=UPI001F50E27A|nr:FtsQ-type POTRA domain-containing protein [Streptomyces sp. CNQ085]MCI0386852.1 FtsQ-type POTRA domain-containing protein [Streptomyces sp. CNQ085]